MKYFMVEAKDLKEAINIATNNTRCAQGDDYLRAHVLCSRSCARLYPTTTTPPLSACQYQKAVSDSDLKELLLL
jgi:hypothetical protein